MPAYKSPPAEIIEMVNEPRPPLCCVSPDEKTLLLVTIDPNPSLLSVAEPVYKLAGIRISANRQGQQHLIYGTGIKLVRLPSGSTQEIDIAEGSKISKPIFDPNGTSFAFLKFCDSSTELWLGDVLSAQINRVKELHINDVLSSDPIVFSSDGKSLWALTISASRGVIPARPPIPRSPIVQETNGRKAPVATHQDLLSDAYDEELFTHLASSQLVRVEVTTGLTHEMGEPALITTLEPSPDDSFLLVGVIQKPYSYRTGHWGFPVSWQIWSKNMIAPARTARGKLRWMFFEKSRKYQSDVQGISRADAVVG